MLYPSKNQRKKYHMFQKQLSSTTVSTLMINQHIIVISKGSCDSEDWRNDTENTDLLHWNKLYLL